MIVVSNKDIFHNCKVFITYHCQIPNEFHAPKRIFIFKDSEKPTQFLSKFALCHKQLQRLKKISDNLGVA